MVKSERREEDGRQVMEWCVNLPVGRMELGREREETAAAFIAFPRHSRSRARLSDSRKQNGM